VIAYTGTAQYDYAPDVAAAFLVASAPASGAAVFNVPGVSSTMDEVIAAIRAVVPDAEISAEGDALPFPPELESGGFERNVAAFPRTSLGDGVAATISHFRRSAGVLG
jgi:hypothetical protein